MTEYGFVAAYVGPDPAGAAPRPGCTRRTGTRCTSAQELGIPLIVHGTNALDPRFRVVPHNYQLSFITEQYLAGQFLSHGDVFERYPEIKVIICHRGGRLTASSPSDERHIAQRDLSENLFMTPAATT